MSVILSVIPPKLVNAMRQKGFIMINIWETLIYNTVQTWLFNPD